MNDVKAGVYRHYKGPLYLLLGLAHDANAENLSTWGVDHHGDLNPLGERTVVVYIGLQLDGAHTGPRLAVRTHADFFAVVCVNTNCRNGGQEVSFRADTCVHCGLPTRQRFTYIGPTWEGHG